MGLAASILLFNTWFFAWLKVNALIKCQIFKIVVGSRYVSDFCIWNSFLFIGNVQSLHTFDVIQVIMDGHLHIFLLAVSEHKLGRPCFIKMLVVAEKTRYYYFGQLLSCSFQNIFFFHYVISPSFWKSKQDVATLESGQLLSCSFQYIKTMFRNFIVLSFLQ